MAEQIPPTPLPRLLLAAPMSGSGKTTLSAGLIAALRRRGLHIAPFKVGPDYIDPGYLGLAAGRSCHNLDAWMLPPDMIRPLLARHSRQADLALIEGVMGLFDGYAGDDDSGSSAQIARLTETPVLLVLDVRAQARTAAALVLGLRDFDPRLQIAGVLLNRVGSAKHAQMVSRAIEDHVGLPVLGALPRSENLHLPERHLGLVPTAEPGRRQEWLDHAAEQIGAAVDLDRLLELARAAPPLEAMSTELPAVAQSVAAPRIAFAQDAAFSFRYADNLTLLRQAGAELLPFSPLSDSELPPGTQAIYLCGGFPELYAGELAANTALRAQIHRAARAGLPIYAECGGLMYLTEILIDGEGKSYPMAGVLPGQSRMTSRLTMGYRTVEAHNAHWLLRPGETLRGHEFHYSSWECTDTKVIPAYRILPDTWQNRPRPDGAVLGNVLASYIHVHFLAFPALAQRFVQAAAQS
jgi:cobyrinic acid a,c-diamide synthase